MPESRDRLPRAAEDSIIASYSQRRVSRTARLNNESGPAIAFVLEDDNEEGQAVVGTPFRWRDTTMIGNTGSIGVAAGSAIRTPRIRPENFRGGVFETPIRRTAPLMGPENLPPAVGSGRSGAAVRGGSVLPSWYPRRPLNDITAFMRAMERSRKKLRGDGEGLQTGDKIATKCCPLTIGKVPKILLDITHHNKGDDDCLTPQKQLLNSIDTVEKVVMEELRKLKRTPSAKKAEREKRVRTLMSMR